MTNITNNPPTSMTFPHCCSALTNSITHTVNCVFLSLSLVWLSKACWIMSWTTDWNWLLIILLLFVARVVLHGSILECQNQFIQTFIGLTPMLQNDFLNNNLENMNFPLSSGLVRKSLGHQLWRKSCYIVLKHSNYDDDFYTSPAFQLVHSPISCRIVMDSSM